MPIIGLTDRPASFPQIGILRKGAPKPERGPGRDLKHFRFDTDDTDAAACGAGCGRAHPPVPLDDAQNPRQPRAPAAVVALLLRAEGRR